MPLQNLILRLGLALWLVAHSGSLTAGQENPLTKYDLVITNARVIDGAGNPWFRADVGVRDGRIAHIGRIQPTEATTHIDARGMIVAPGFIDVHTHVEGIFDQPEAENFVRMGVTSLVTGNCGSSATDINKFLGGVAEHPLAVNLGNAGRARFSACESCRTRRPPADG